MHLTATGTGTRRALVLILHDASQPPTSPAPHWTPRGFARLKCQPHSLVERLDLLLRRSAPPAACAGYSITSSARVRSVGAYFPL